MMSVDLANIQFGPQNSYDGVVCFGPGFLSNIVVYDTTGFNGPSFVGGGILASITIELDDSSVLQNLSENDSSSQIVYDDSIAENQVLMNLSENDSSSQIVYDDSITENQVLMNLSASNGAFVPYGPFFGINTAYGPGVPIVYASAKNKRNAVVIIN